MDYEKAYKEALGWIRKIYPTLTGTNKEDAEHYFPELKESEDERIRTRLIALVETFGQGTYKDEMLAYLEKQKELDKCPEYCVRSNCIGCSIYEKQKEQKWSPSEGEMGVLYKLCYISNQITDEDDTELTRLYQDLKREYFNGHSFENMFLNEKQKEQNPVPKFNVGDYVKDTNYKGAPTINSDWFEEHCYKQPHWKPSEEQMRALENVIKCEVSAGLHVRAEIIQSLLNDLKKL